MDKILLTAIILGVLLSGCATPEQRIEKPDVISGTGTVKYLSLEGGFYGIIADDGKNYRPTNLPREFAVDGLRVSFKAKISRQQVSIYMWGTAIEIVEIKKIEIRPAPPVPPSPAVTAAPTSAPISTAPPAPTINYRDSPFGMHPATVNNQYSEALDMGVKWHRPSIYMFWSKVQPDTNNDSYDFSFYDSYYGSVPSRINILANIAADNPKIGTHLLPGSYLPINKEKYLKFVKAAIERYDGDGINDMPNLKNPITYWQVENEPNNRGKIKDFAELQKITYEAIKSACAQCKVLIGGAAQPVHPEYGFIADKDEYFQRFSEDYEPYLQELNGKGFDIFDFHWYGNAEGDYRKMGQVYEQMKVLLKKYGFGNAPVWVTEMGAYSGCPSDKKQGGGKIFSCQTETQQAADYLKRFVYPLSLGVEKIFPAFGLIEGFKGNDGYFDHTGFIYEGKGSNDLGYGVKKLSYYTYKKMVEVLEGSDWNNIKTIQEKDGIYVYKFSKNGKNIYVAWNDNSAEKQITITGIGSNQVKITEAVPKYESGKDVTDYNTAFNTETKTAQNGKITITLKDKPVFVEEI